MFVDGLWASGMTLHIHRNGVPIPKEMQANYIKIELTAVQMNAIAAVLGLGYRDGELLYYKDDDVDRNIMRDDGFGIKSEYYAINSEARSTRKSIRVSKSFASSDAGQNVTVVQDSNGMFDFRMPENSSVPFGVSGDAEDDGSTSVTTANSPFGNSNVAKDVLSGSQLVNEYANNISNKMGDKNNSGLICFDDDLSSEDAGKALDLDSDILNILYSNDKKTPF